MFPFADLSDGPIPAALIKDDRSDNWEKGPFLSNVLAGDPTRPVVWIDDQCRVPEPAKHMRDYVGIVEFRGFVDPQPRRATFVYATRPGPTLVVQPCSFAGLLPADLIKIEAFLRAPHEIPHGVCTIENADHWHDPTEVADFRRWLAWRTTSLSVGKSL